MFCCGDIVVRKQGKPSANRRPVSRNCSPVATLSIGQLRGLPPVLNRAAKRTGAADSSGELGFAASDCFVMRIEAGPFTQLHSVQNDRNVGYWAVGLIGFPAVSGLPDRVDARRIEGARVRGDAPAALCFRWALRAESYLT